MCQNRLVVRAVLASRLDARIPIVLLEERRFQDESLLQRVLDSATSLRDNTRSTARTFLVAQEHSPSRPNTKAFQSNTVAQENTQTRLPQIDSAFQAP